MKKPPDLEKLVDAEQLVRSLILHVGSGLILFALLTAMRPTLLWAPLVLLLLYFPGYFWRRRLKPFWRASRFMASGDYEAAAEAFEAFAKHIEQDRSLLKLQPWLDIYNAFRYRSNARINAGVCRLELGQADRARASMESVLSEEPDNYLALNNLGMVAWKTGDVDAAFEHFSRAVDLAPGYAPARINLGETALATKRYDLAENVLEQVPASARDARYEYLRAQTLLALGNDVEARRHCDLGIKFNPDHEQLARLQTQLAGTASVG